MRLTPLMLLMCAGVTLGCNSGKAESDDDGDGTASFADARLITDVFTWDCEDRETGEVYQGAFGQAISLEHAPRSLQTLRAPPGGCSANTNMFPTDAGDGGVDLAFIDEPEWETDVDEGVLRYVAPGFYRDEVFPDVRTCKRVTEILSGGTRLVDSGSLSGISTPDPAPVPIVTFSGLSTNPDTGAESIGWGDPVVASWDAHEWDEVWVQIRREREGEAWESVTCDATGGDDFAMDDAVWALMDENIQVEQNQLYVAFQRTDSATTADGLVVETVTRAMAVAIVQD
ncbi:MAG: hypothetical protein VX265_03080 [Myxococcota bacterium]|nr:hypothetical protein [Myxococcota bacterium]